MKKTFQQFIAENPHFCDVQGLRESANHGDYFRTALEKAWQAGYEAAKQAALQGAMEEIASRKEPMKHADITDATSPYDKRLGATGTPVE